MHEISGKTALITGASIGIGAATAIRMAELGANVVLAARSADKIAAIEKQIKSDGGKAIAVQCDVSSYHDVNTAVQTCISEFGGIDILVNNAGVIDPIARLTDCDPGDWGNVIDINVKGVFNALHSAIPHMEKQGSGVIVNISSGAATSALEGWSHYCASKAAALSLTRCTHKEMADRGIRVVGLSPGTVATQMQVQIKSSGINPVSKLEVSDHISPEWVAEAICWLTTGDAQEFDGDDVSLRDETIRKRIGLI